MTSASQRCPDCHSMIGGPSTTCPACALPLYGPQYYDLRRLDDELAALEHRRSWLWGWRQHLIAQLRRASRYPVPQPVAAAGGWSAGPMPTAPPVPRPPEAGAPWLDRPRRDMSQFAVQHLLLLLGGVLLGAAAIVFTVVTWEHPSIRAATLTAITGVTLALPWFLVWRRLNATAETVGYLGLVMLPLSGLAIATAMRDQPPAGYRLVVPGVADLWWTTALLALSWAAYARFAPLRLPRPTALVLAQAPLPLAALTPALAGGPAITAMAAGLLCTATLDLGVWLWTSGRVRTVALFAGFVTGLAGTVLAIAAAVFADGPGEAWRGGGVALFAALLAGTCARFVSADTRRWPISVISGVALLAAVPAPVAVSLPVGWKVTAYAGAACLLLAVASRFGGLLRPGLTDAGVITLGAAVMWVSPVAAYVGGRWWVATPPCGPECVDSFGPYPAPGAVALVLALASAAMLAASIWARNPICGVPAQALRAWFRCAALFGGALAVLHLLVAVDAPLTAAAAVLIGASAALLAVAARSRTAATAATAGSTGAYLAALALIRLAAGDPATVQAFSVAVVACFIAAGVFSRTPVAQVITGAGAVLAGCWALGQSWTWPGTIPLALLEVRALALLITMSRLRVKRPVQAIAIDAASHIGALVAVAIIVAEWAGDVFGTAVGVEVLPGLDGSGAVAVALAVAAVLAAGSAWARKRQAVAEAWTGVALGEAYVLAVLAPLPLGRALFPALFGPYGWVADAWAGAPEMARAALSPGGPWHEEPLLLPVLVITGLAVVLAAAVHAGRAAALGAGGAIAPVVVVLLPLAADLPYWAALAFLVTLMAVLALWAAASRSAARGATLYGASLWTASLTVSWSLADRTATLAVLAAMGLAGLWCVLWGRTSPVAALSSAVVALVMGAEGATVALAYGIPAHQAAFVVLATAVLAVRAGRLLPASSVAGHALLLAALPLWIAALLMTLPYPDHFVLVLAIGGCTAVLAAGRLSGEARYAVAGLGCALAVGALLAHLPALALAYAGPYAFIAAPWTGQTALALDVPSSPVFREGILAAPVGLIAAWTIIGAVRLLDGTRAAYRTATIAVPLAVLLIPVSVDMPHLAALGLAGGLLVMVSARAALARGFDPCAAGMALWLMTLVVAWSLPAKETTIGVLASLTVLGTAGACLARTSAVRAGAAAITTFSVAGLVAAVWLAAGLRTGHLAYAELAVAALACLIAYWIASLRSAARGPSLDLAVEAAGYVVVAAALAVGAADPSVLAVAGCVLLAVALREDRHPVVFAGLALLQLASWWWLVQAGVMVPEAYTGTVTVAGLAVGWWQRERLGSSWIAYGPWLLLTAVPSLVEAWHDPGLTRPVLLVAVALAVTLTGASAGLQAPMFLGGAVLLLIAGRELGPAVLELVGRGPRWVPIAASGLVLLFTGATYEHRRRDLRRLRGSIARMW